MELMLNGVFGNLEKHQLAALVSCLVPSDKSEVAHYMISRCLNIFDVTM